jgi:hypothetical protein
MNQNMNQPSTQTEALNWAIDANLNALALRLDAARHLVIAARSAMAERRGNLAIGTILPLETMLPESDALYRIILLLHRAAGKPD